MTKEEIATILKRLRQEAGLTQKYVAEMTGKKQQTIASWECGQSQPDADTLFKLCEIYGVSVNAAFGFAEYNPMQSKFDKELLTAFHAANEVTQKNVCLLLGIESVEDRKAANM